ncbi:hypothetical protein ACIRRA_24610 [Nocardia sp. NPDC101769]|uniref:hypothetical protein n=1 Tax=Nocardia sp. NPDC101769 TaxID=3364333 RepID=UPI00381D65A7
MTALEASGEVQTIDQEVDWQLEIGAVIRHSYDLCAPAPLFTNITDYQGTGFRVLGAPGATSKRSTPTWRARSSTTACSPTTTRTADVP